MTNLLFKEEKIKMKKLADDAEQMRVDLQAELRSY